MGIDNVTDKILLLERRFQDEVSKSNRSTPDIGTVSGTNLDSKIQSLRQELSSQLDNHSSETQNFFEELKMSNFNLKS
jgi:hypothetical protein